MTVVTSPVDLEKPQKLPFGPFHKWLLGAYVKHGESPAQLSMVTGLSLRRIEQYLAGRQFDKRIKDPVIREISIDIPDRALIEEGSTSLWEVYPVLYS